MNPLPSLPRHRIAPHGEESDGGNGGCLGTKGVFAERERSRAAMEGMSTVTMPSSATFASGSAQLTPEGKELIDTIWEVLSKYPDRDIFIEGHTDSIPIGPALAERYPSNWALSAARAVSVLQYVLSKHQTESGRLGAVGFGEYRPIATNSTVEGRSLNRRVVIAVRPRE